MDPNQLDLTIKLSDSEGFWEETSNVPTSSLRTYTRTVNLHVTENIQNFLNPGSKSDDDEPTVHYRTVKHSKDLEEGEEVDYELLRILGKGGMGTVYKARQKATGRDVALKVLESDDTQVRWEFTREAIINANLEHPGIIRVYELAIDEELGLFYTMERIKGRPWGDVIKKQKLEEKLSIFMRLSDAVSYAHSHGIIHRDLKPSNVMLGEFGNILLVDWGLALSREEITACREIPNLYGSLPYMAPEMLTTNTRDLGVHSDVYMLGGILYQIMTGKPPHPLEGEIKPRLRAIRENSIAEPAGYPLLGQIAMKALSKVPADRYASVADMAHSVETYQKNRSVYALVQNGKTHLKNGTQNKSLFTLTRALFAFEDALEMLPTSETARNSVTEAQEAIATCALEQGDVEYAARMVNSAKLPESPLTKKVDLELLHHRKRKKRVKFFGLLSGVAAVLILLAVSGGLALVMLEKGRTESALQTASGEREKAVTALADAESARQTAEVERERAQQAQLLAEAEQKKAVDTLAMLQAQEAKTAVAEAAAQDASSKARLAREAAARDAYRAQIASLSRQVERGLPFARLSQRLNQLAPPLRGPEWSWLHGSDGMCFLVFDLPKLFGVSIVHRAAGLIGVFPAAGVRETLGDEHRVTPSICD